MSAFKFRNNTTNDIIDWDDAFSTEATATMPGALAAVGAVAVGTALPSLGRITLTSGTPILTSTVAGATTYYYTPYLGTNCCIYNGTQWNNHIFSELSQTTSDATNATAATVQDTAYDLFLTVINGAITLIRGPAWTTTVSGTCASVIPIASPGVVNWTAHGLHEASPVVFTGNGLPTGLVSGTTYYVSANPGTNSFNVAASPGTATVPTNINFTGSESGNVVVTNGDSVRGTGAGTTELIRLNGLLVNKNAILNGASTTIAAANQALYVGTIRTDANNQVTVQFGARASSPTPGVFYIWNMYNRIRVASDLGTTASSVSYTSITIRAFNGNNANWRTNFIVGWSEEEVMGIAPLVTDATAGGGTRAGCQIDDSTTYGAGSTNTDHAAGIGFYVTIPAIGGHFITVNQNSAVAGGTANWYFNFSSGGFIESSTFSTWMRY